MDPINPKARREALHEQISEAQMILRRAAAAAALKGDPLAEQLQALALCVGALSDLYQASEATQIDIANTLKTQTGAIANEAIAQVHASGMDIVNKLGPQLANAAERTMRMKITTLRIRSIVALGLALSLSILVPSLFTYAAGLNDGRFQAEVAAHLIPAAMKASPAEALAWGQLMQDNDGATAMAACRKSIQQDADGRHYCFMPVWTDPISPAVPSATAQ
ncbi:MULTISPECIES: hypothetical protein [unclassified Acidocella]|uniref:hypothetical protein n=1 Tax=unclassified Acidocella TaxID=2648610 RepID=UPI00028C7D48|nr:MULTISPECIES: hypothetical protein [unclassified Acidocella]EKM98188.1 hypothetical protein MXAZACID_16749 [Acidocella sp. MX-AZ02]WBO61072.1 hypothetical protein GT370_10380 [Acidocella sp. MX-AZ03]